MAVHKYFLVFSIALLSVWGQEDVTHIVVKEKCINYCQETYGAKNSFLALHISQGDVEKSCERGCRFAGLAILIGDQDSSNGSKDQCDNDCKLAYDDLSQAEVHSCYKGCEAGKVEESVNKITEDVPQAPLSITATPVLQVRKVMAQVIGSLQIIRTSVMTYFLQEDNTLLAVQSQPQIIVEMLPRGEGDDNPENIFGSEAEGGLNELSDSFPEYKESRVQILEGSEANLEGVSRVHLGRSHQYTYLLHLIMLLGSVSLTLLGLSYCLAIVRHQQKKNMKVEKMGGLGIVLRNEPLKLVRPEDLTKLSLMEEDAPALPNKHDLDLPHANV